MRRTTDADGGAAITSEHAFLQAIKDAPTDFDLRRIFADWLEDNGQPQRAELIRLQVERACLPRLMPSEVRPYFRRSLTREKELLDQYGEGWLGPWCGLGAFRRGLIQIRDVGPKRLRKLLATEGAESVLHWVESLRLVGEWKEVRPLLNGTWLRHLVGLRLRYNESASLAAGEAGAAALADSAHLGQLTHLDLSWNSITDSGAAALAASAHLARLTYLDLKGNDIGDTGAEALAASAHLGKLTFLDLRSNDAIGYQTQVLIQQLFGRASATYFWEW